MDGLWRWEEPASKNFRAGMVPGLSWLLSTTPLFAARTDVVELQNGDRITGEVKGLERGMLEIRIGLGVSYNVANLNIDVSKSSWHDEMETRYSGGVVSVSIFW